MNVNPQTQTTKDEVLKTLDGIDQNLYPEFGDEHSKLIYPQWFPANYIGRPSGALLNERNHYVNQWQTIAVNENEYDYTGNL